MGRNILLIKPQTPFSFGRFLESEWAEQATFTFTWIKLSHRHWKIHCFRLKKTFGIPKKGEGVTQPWASEVHRSHLSLYQLYNSSSRPNSRIHYNEWVTQQRFFEQYWHIQRNVEMWNTLSAPMSCNTLFCIPGPAAIMRGEDERHKCFSFRGQLSLKN